MMVVDLNDSEKIVLRQAFALGWLSTDGLRVDDRFAEAVGLEGRGLLRYEIGGGPARFRITDAGREVAAELGDGPWD